MSTFLGKVEQLKESNLRNQGVIWGDLQGAGYATGVSNYKVCDKTTFQHFQNLLVMRQKREVL